MKRILLFMTVMLLLVATAWAQEKMITGRVISSEDGLPMPGVNISVKGTSKGSTTDVNGAYSLNVDSGATLEFSFVGYATQTVVVGNQTSIDVALTSDAKDLSEVVVVGYGTQLKQDLTGNIAGVSGKEIQNTPVLSVEQAIQGRAAGVFIESQNGKLGQGIKMRVRGSSSVSAGNQPLYVVDGIPITSQDLSSTSAATNPLADINFNDVESIQILKDASAGAIYGSRASNGVVLITTKRGKAGKTKFTLNYFTGFSKETNRREFLNSSDFVMLEREAGVNADKPSNGGKDDGFYADFVESRLKRYSAGNDDYKTAAVNTDWQDQVFRRGATNQIDLNIAGGTDKTRFFVSGQYSKQQGILIGNAFDRFSGRINLDHQATNKLLIGANFSLARTQNDRLSNDNAFSTPLQIVALSPITPLIDPRSGLPSGTPPGPSTNYPVYYNPLININNAYFKTVVFRNISNVFASYDITKRLTFRTEFGLDLLNQNEDQYEGRATFRNSGTPNGQGFNANTTVLNYTTNNFLRYTATLSEMHNIEAVGGMSYQQSGTNYASVTGQQFPSDAYKTIASAAVYSAATTTLTNFSFLSYFARANYRFSNKYLVSLSGRVDGSSRFGANTRYGFFPAASVGWVLTEESFLNNSTLLSFLKARGSYGLTGNAEIGNFPSLGLFAASNIGRNLINAGYVGIPGQAPSQLPNPNLKWETTAQADFGVDFGFFNNRITGEIDYYQKKTNDLLLNVNVPGTTGFSTQTRNVGKLENKGIEVVLNTQNTVGVFQWSTSLNLAANRNKITDLNGQQLGTNDLNRAIEGQPIGVFYGREFAGADPANGNALYYLNTQNADGTTNHQTTDDYNAAQRVVLGNPNPKLIGGITNTFGFKGFELSILLQGVSGNKIYNGGGQYMSASASNGFDNQTVDQLRRWQKPGDITDVPEARLFGANGTNPSSRYVSDGSYLRVKTVTLGYSLPGNIISRLKMDRIRIYATAQNLFTFTSYKGWDPEVNADYQATNINQGVDFYSAPQPKTITFGINLGF
jgi:TonB-linked SusC/RagA family outer membrane protein